MYDNNLLDYITTLFDCLIDVYVLFYIRFLYDYSKAEDISTVVSQHTSIGSLPRLPGTSRAKYLVDEVPEYNRVHTINYCEASARTYTFHIYLQNQRAATTSETGLVIHGAKLWCRNSIS